MKLTRTQLADYLIAERGSRSALRLVASYLISHGRVKELDVLMRQVEARLQAQGHVTAHVSVARPLPDVQKHTAESVVHKLHPNTKYVEIIDTIDPSLLGGMVIQTPEMEVDVSLRAKLNSLTAPRQSNQQIRSDQ